MSWVRLDDMRADNPKLMAAGFEARGLDETAICWCAANDRSGRIPWSVVIELARRHGCARPALVVRRLIDVGLWSMSELGVYQIDLAGVQFSSPRKTKIRSALRLVIFVRDGRRCLFCGSEDNLTVDHVHPESKGGPTNEANLQTLCRSCNSKKGARL